MRHTIAFRWGGPAPGADIRLHPSAAASAAAWRALAEDDLPAELLEAAQLVVGELVTNSVRHSRGNPDQWIGVRADARAGGLRLEVCDQGPGLRLPPPSSRARLTALADGAYRSSTASPTAGARRADARGRWRSGRSWTGKQPLW